MNPEIMRSELEVKLLEWFEFLTAKYNFSSTIWQFALSQEGLPAEDLTEAEKEIFKSFSSARRQASWLRGRQALSQLVSAEQRTKVKFPCPFLSISHSGELALAFSVQNINGVGVDIQVSKVVKSGFERRFLQAEEDKYLQQSVDVLKLWCAKEALYKANANNRGTFLRDYRILALNKNFGLAKWQQQQFEFLVLSLHEYFFGFAVCVI